MSASKAARPVAGAPAAPAATVAWVTQEIPVGTDRVAAARIYGRRTGAGATPLVLHFHGGAFVGGSLDSGTAVATLLAQAGAVVVSIDYPLAPAHPFPLAAEAGHAALSWLHRNRRRLGGERAVVLVAGEEAGGNLAAAVALMSRDRQRPPLAGQILLSPMLDPCLGTASLRDSGLDLRECPWASGWADYLARAADAGHPYAAPGICLRLGKLPPTLLITAQDDPMRDEALAFGRRLCEAGVRVDQLVVQETTGWPRSYRCELPEQKDWPGQSRQELARFFISLQEPAMSPTGQVS